MMKRPFSTYRAAAVALLASGLGMTAVTAQAQQSREPLEEIIILEAPAVVRYPEKRSPIGAPSEVVELTRRVSYADLDLGQTSDVNMLENRIDVTAKETCRDLSEMFAPYMSADETRTCERRAIADAMEQVEMAVAVATGPSAQAGNAMQAAERAAKAAERAAQAAKQAAAAAQKAAKEARAARERAENLGE